MKQRGTQSIRSRFMVLLSVSAMLALSVPGPVDARQPITGVSCQGGFFVWMRDGRVFWIHGEPERKELVYSGASQLVAMAMCDTGVLSVFENKDEPSMNSVFYSPDCRNIGEEAGNSIPVASRAAPIKRIAHTPDAVTLHFGTGEPVSNDICTRKTMD